MNLIRNGKLNLRFFKVENSKLTSKIVFNAWFINRPRKGIESISREGHFVAIKKHYWTLFNIELVWMRKRKKNLLHIVQSQEVAFISFWNLSSDLSGVTKIVGLKNEFVDAATNDEYVQKKKLTINSFHAFNCPPKFDEFEGLFFLQQRVNYCISPIKRSRWFQRVDFSSCVLKDVWLRRNYKLKQIQSRFGPN